MTTDNNRLARDTPATYQICVQGTLSAAWFACLGNLTIEPAGDAGYGPITLLIGELADQAALLGVLNNIYDLGYPLLSCTISAAAHVDGCDV